LWTQVPGGFHVDVVTPKGESLVSAHRQRPGGAGARDQSQARRRAFADRPIARARLDREPLQRRAMATTGYALPWVWSVCRRLSELPLLRYRRRALEPSARRTTAQLGYLPSGALYAAQFGSQSPWRPKRSLPATPGAQVFDLSPALRRDLVHGLRPLRAGVPGGHGPTRNSPRYRYGRA
jgi:hypothetical protein